MTTARLREESPQMIKLQGKSKRKTIALFGAGALLAVALAGFALIYFVIFPTSSPAPFKLNTVTAGTRIASTTSATSSSRAGGALAGSWTVSAGSQAGYRVREKLAFLPAQSDAVGRTSQISGSATFTQAGSSVRISAAKFNIAVNTLKSDREMRDEKIKEIGLESARYPTASFTLSRPVTVPTQILTATAVKVEVLGVVTIHGVSKVQEIPVEMRASGGVVQAVGSLTFPWSEFGMTAPSVGGFVNVTEHATMEFDLQLARA
jgi:polyisoprenoid-binding protein YceI